ncbi:MAG: molybdopterin-guanine dinucleotide biosynthesis protein B [Alphaproteobacteria bacterium]
MIGPTAGILGITGWSGSGKTTLITAILPVLAARGLRVSTVKHAHHDVDLDVRGKDTHRHRKAGAVEVMLATAKRWALLHELPEGELPPLDALLAHMTAVDLVLVEGFKSRSYPQVLLHRAGQGKPLPEIDGPHVVAIASDSPIPDAKVPVLPLNEPAVIAEFAAGFSRDSET